MEVTAKEEGTAPSLLSWQYIGKWVFGVVLLGLPLVAGCTYTEQNAPASITASITASTAVASEPSTKVNEPIREAMEPEGSTRLVVDAVGREVRIPADPQRIVTYQSLDDLLWLGLTPVGAEEKLIEASAAEEQLTGIASVGRDPESLLELAPDLILAKDQEQLDLLVQVAPTLVLSAQGEDTYSNVYEIARLLDREEQAERRFVRLQEQAADVRKQMTTYVDDDSTISLLRTYGEKSLRLYGDGGAGFTLYRLLGLKPPLLMEAELGKGQVSRDDQASQSAYHAKPVLTYKDLSLELLPEAAGDWLFMLPLGKDEGKLHGALSDNPLWESLPAVQQGQVVMLDYDLWSASGPFAYEKQLEQLPQLLEKAVAGKNEDMSK